MKDRVLFRGFLPTAKDTAKIQIGGDTIRGRWIYWNEYGQLCRRNGDLICDDLHHVVQVQRNDVVEATVGQLVLLDTRKRFFFDGDLLRDAEGTVFEIVRSNAKVELAVVQTINSMYTGKTYSFTEVFVGGKEIVGNRWEV